MLLGIVTTAAFLGTSVLGIVMIQGMLPLDPDPYLAFFQMLGIMMGVSVVVGGIIYAPIGILIAAFGKGYKTYGRNSYSISVVYNKAIIPSSDNLASYQQKY